MARSLVRPFSRLRDAGLLSLFSKEANGSVNVEKWCSTVSAGCSRFIPLSSKTLFKKLMNGKEGYDEKSLQMFEKFAVRVGAVISNENSSFLPEMKSLYDPLNPDVATTTYKILQKEELLDREFWFLQEISSCLSKAGFYEIDKVHLKKSFARRPVGQGVVANVQQESFEILRCWVLSDVEIQSTESWKPYMQSFSFLLEESPSNKLFKRVIMATRLKNEDKMSLRLFKDIPSNQLHLLLPPTGGLKMDESYRKLLYITSGMSALFFISKCAVASLVGSSHHLGYLPVGFSALFGIASVALWTNFKQRQKRYLNDIIEVMYHRFVIGNQNLLAVVTDKVQEEALKGILITYFFLSHRGSQEKSDILPGTNASILENKVSSWIKSQTGQEVSFNARSSVAWLTKMGIVETDLNTDEIKALSPPDALKVLPMPGQQYAPPHFSPIKAEEFDLFYGDLAEATNLEKQDFVDKITSAMFKQLNKFQKRL